VVSVPDSGSEKHGFESQSRRCRVTVLGKLFTPKLLYTYLYHIVFFQILPPPLSFPLDLVWMQLVLCRRPRYYSWAEVARSDIYLLVHPQPDRVFSELLSTCRE